MNNHILSRSALALGVLLSLSAAPALAAGGELIVHDEGNSGPSVVQAEPHHAASAQPASAPHLELVVHDEGSSAPEFVVR